MDSSPAGWEEPSQKRINRHTEASTNGVEEGTLIEFIVVPGLIITTITSTLLLMGLKDDWTLRDNVYHTIINARTMTQL